MTSVDAHHSQRLECALCHSTNATTFFEATDHREQLGGRFAIVGCADCGLVRTEPRPDDLGSWYPPEYRNHSAREPLTVRVIGRALAYNAGSGRNELMARLASSAVPNAAVGPPLPRGARVLDVGAGNGSAVARLRAAGLDAWGVEPSEAAVAVAHGNGTTTVVAGTMETTPLAHEKWDLIRFTHVLEHVPNPVATLSSAAKALTPSGRIVILVPNFAGAGRRLFGNAWDGLEVPRHLHHFTAGSLTQVLAAAGLRVRSMHTAALFGVIPASVDAWTCGGARQRGWGGSIVVRAASYPLDLVLAAIGLGEGLVAVAVPTGAQGGGSSAM